VNIRSPSRCKRAGSANNRNTSSSSSSKEEAQNTSGHHFKKAMLEVMVEGHIQHLDGINAANCPQDALKAQFTVMHGTTWITKNTRPVNGSARKPR
jgi:UDP-2,3-diacylglucosamine pyrophosphatase LpxH